ncbi:hypothetical protein FRC19_008867 [Serendipita sp. 401]|nr:hypothetical protein FRC19_008867 [Serendipita sp. 401]
MNGFLLLPDKVLLGLSTRITSFLFLRAAYSIIDTALPLIFRNASIRVLTPSLTYSADGFIWLIVFYNLYNLAHPAENWIDQQAAHLVRGFQSVSIVNTDSTQYRDAVDVEAGSPERVSHETSDEQTKATRWSRLLSPFKTHRTYGAAGDHNPEQPRDYHSQPNPEGTRAESGPSPNTATEDEQRQHADSQPEVAIIHGVSASGTQVYAQTGPMAPAWLLQDVVVNGQAGAAYTKDT